MTDFFKTVRAYLRGKWEKRQAEFYRHVPRNLTVIDTTKLRTEIARLRRNKKKHSHLQKQLDDLLNGGAQTNDQQMETTK